MDSSQNIAFKTKDEVQTVHFSGKQHSLHCIIVIDENDALSYVYHLSDDTGHDPIFVDETLNDIFGKWNIRNETILFKSDNAGNQYKASNVEFWCQIDPKEKHCDRSSML